MDAVVTPAAAPSGEPGHRSPTLSDEERSRLSSEICRISKAWVSQVAQMQQLDAAVVAQHRLLEVWLESMTRADRLRLAADYGPGNENG